MGRTIWTVANVVMLLMFIASVAVQVNDPDPIGWMAIYGAAAVATGMELARRTRLWMPVLIEAISIVWAATIAPRVIGKIPFGSMFQAFEMKDLGVEESREMYGLVLIALWMSAIFVAAWRRKARGVT
jgi:hypothetical protein